MRTRTDKVPNTSATAASSGSDLNGAAVRDACSTLCDVSRPLPRGSSRNKRARPSPRRTWIFVRLGARSRTVGLRDRVCRRVPAGERRAGQPGGDRILFHAGPPLGWKTASGRPFNYFAGGVAVAEVEVDGYTGMKPCLRVDILHDVGDSLNPGVDRGQIEGGFVQGMGWLTGEELNWDDRGPPPDAQREHLPDPGLRRRARWSSTSRSCPRPPRTARYTAARRSASRR